MVQHNFWLEGFLYSFSQVYYFRILSIHFFGLFFIKFAFQLVFRVELNDGLFVSNSLVNKIEFSAIENRKIDSKTSKRTKAIVFMLNS